mgnify:CR=1 FL=1
MIMGELKIIVLQNILCNNKKYSVVANNKYNIERGVEGQYQAYGMVSYATGKMSIVCKPKVILTENSAVSLTTADTIVFESDDITYTSP